MSVAVQETRGGLADLSQLPLSHKHFGAFSATDPQIATSPAGRLIVSVSATLMSRARDAKRASLGQLGEVTRPSQGTKVLLGDWNL